MEKVAFKVAEVVFSATGMSDFYWFKPWEKAKAPENSYIFGIREYTLSEVNAIRQKMVRDYNLDFIPSTTQVACWVCTHAKRI